MPLRSNKNRHTAELQVDEKAAAGTSYARHFFSGHWAIQASTHEHFTRTAIPVDVSSFIIYAIVQLHVL